MCTCVLALGDIKVTPAVGAYDYYINVCGAVQGACAAHPSTFVCQVRKSPANQFESVLAYSDVDMHPPAPSWGPSASSTGNNLTMPQINPSAAHVSMHHDMNRGCD